MGTPARSHHLRRRSAHVTLLPAAVSVDVRPGPGPVQARRAVDEEGSRLVPTVRRGTHGPVRARWAMITAPVPGALVPAIARLVAGAKAQQDTRHVLSRLMPDTPSIYGPRHQTAPTVRSSTPARGHGP
jgi:hypothetical protein